MLFQLEMAEIMVDLPDSNLTGSEAMMSAVATASARASMVFGVAWVLLEIGRYLVAVALFRPSPASAA